MSHVSFSRCLLLLAASAVLTGAASAQFVDVAAGSEHSLALKCDGTVVAWGNNSYGECNVPALPSGVTYVGIAAGGTAYWSSGGLSLALRSDGSVAAWGYDEWYWGLLNVPPLPSGLTYVEVAAGPNHALARLSDGTVVAWGSNEVRQCNVPALPPGLSYVEIAAGGATHVEWMWNPWWGGFEPFYYFDGFSVGRRSDGSVVVWGFDHHVTDVPALPSGKTYVQISAGGDHIVARVSDGSVVAWGENGFGQTSVPPLPPGRTCVDVAAGGGHSAALLSDGSILSWGNPLSTSTTTTPGGGTSPLLPSPPGQTYQALALGGEGSGSSSAFHHLIALRSDGSLEGWGENWFGQAKVPAGWSFEDLGLGLAGTLGVPQLTGHLDCPTGSGQPVTLTLQVALPSSPSFLVVGRRRVDLPLLGGTLVPSPDVVRRGLTGPDGAQAWSGLTLPDLPTGSALYAQVWVEDSGAPSGWSASNAIVLEAP